MCKPFTPTHKDGWLCAEPPFEKTPWSADPGNVTPESSSTPHTAPHLAFRPRPSFRQEARQENKGQKEALGRANIQFLRDALGQTDIFMHQRPPDLRDDKMI